jgi:hypothetical protein
MRATVDVHAFLICESAPVDDDGKWNVHSVFDSVWAAAYPAVHARLSAYFRLTISEKIGQRVPISLAFTNPVGLRQVLPETPSAFIGPTGGIQGTINIQGFPLPEPGRYVFELVVDGDVVSRYTIHATLGPEKTDGKTGRSQLH